MKSILLFVSLVASTVSAGILGDVTKDIRRDDMTERIARRMIEDSTIERRVTTTTTTDASTWDTEAAAACQSAMSTMDPTNPSGLAACYNIAVLDNSTGVFQADLRLYKMKDASGTFAGVTADKVMVGLSYNEATVSLINASDLARRDGLPLVSVSLVHRETSLEERASSITLTERYAFVGQVDQSAMSTTTNSSTFQSILLPTVSLSATDTSGAAVNTTLRSDMASYVAGVFAKAATDTTASSVTAAQVTAVAPFNIPSGTIFVVPGTAIILFPVGGIITGVWTVLFIATFSFGTIGRLQFREQYRRNAARATGGAARI